MKRFVCLMISILAVIALTACGKEPVAPNADMISDFAVTQGGTKYAGRLERGDNNTVITMTSPDTVNGVGFTYTADELSISCGDHKTTAPRDYLPPTSAPSALYNALTYIDQASYIGSDDGIDSFSVPTPNGAAVIMSVDGEPVSLTDNNSGLTFTFS